LFKKKNKRIKKPPAATEEARGREKNINNWRNMSSHKPGARIFLKIRFNPIFSQNPKIFSRFFPQFYKKRH